MLNILFEDQSIIVAEKPAGLESQATRKLEPDMVSEIKKHIHKLSTPSSGKKGRTLCRSYPQTGQTRGGNYGLRKDQGSRGVFKQAGFRTVPWKNTTWLLLCGNLVDNVGNFVDTLLKDGKTNHSRVVDKDEKGGKQGRTGLSSAQPGDFGRAAGFSGGNPFENGPSSSDPGAVCIPGAFLSGAMKSMETGRRKAGRRPRGTVSGSAVPPWTQRTAGDPGPLCLPSGI